MPAPRTLPTNFDKWDAAPIPAALPANFAGWDVPPPQSTDLGTGALERPLRLGMLDAPDPVAPPVASSPVTGRRPELPRGNPTAFNLPPTPKRIAPRFHPQGPIGRLPAVTTAADFGPPDAPPPPAPPQQNVPANMTPQVQPPPVQPVVPGPTTNEQVARKVNTLPRGPQTITAPPQKSWLEDQLAHAKQMIVGGPGVGDTAIGRALGYQFEGPQDQHVENVDLPLLNLRGAGPSDPQSAGQGVARGLGEVATGLTTPGNLLTMAATQGLGALAGPFSKAREIVPRAISAYFTVDMLKGLYDQVPEVKAAVDSGDPGKIAQAFTQAASTGAFAVLSGKHALTGGPSAEVEPSAVAKPMDIHPIDAPAPAEPPPPAPPPMNREQRRATVIPQDNPEVQELWDIASRNAAGKTQVNTRVYAQALEIAKNEPSFGRKMLIDRLGVSNAAAERLLTRMQEDGVVQSAKNDRGRPVFHWRREQPAMQQEAAPVVEQPPVANDVIQNSTVQPVLDNKSPFEAPRIKDEGFRDSQEFKLNDGRTIRVTQVDWALGLDGNAYPIVQAQDVKTGENLGSGFGSSILYDFKKIWGATPVTQPKPQPQAVVEPPPEAPKTAEVQTTPEQPATLDIQFGQLRDGSRSVVMVPKGTELAPDAVPPGMRKAIIRGVGRFYYDPKAMAEQEIYRASRDNRLNEILGSKDGGMGAPDKSQLQGEPVAVVARDANGTEAQAIAADQRSVDSAVEQAKKLTPPGGNVEITRPEEVIAEREGGRPDIQGTIISEQPKEGVELNRGTRPGEQSQEPPVLGSRKPNGPTVRGDETEVLVPGEGTTYRTRYEVRELGDVYASHDGVTFQPRPEYAYRNERDYNDPRNRERVVKDSLPDVFDPRYLITDNPDATNGPPVIDIDGNTVGGNSRVMKIERAFRGETHPGLQKYRDLLAKKAAQFGIDPAQVASMREPVLVRVMDPESGAKAQSRGIRDLNKPSTAELTSAERAIADSKRISADTLDYLSRKIEQEGDEGTLAQALEGPSGAEILNRLVDDGVITTQEKGKALDATGKLEKEFKERIGKLMLGRLFREPRQLDTTPPSVKNKLERIIAPLARLQDTEWDLTPQVREAMDLLELSRAHNEPNLDMVLKQSGLFGDQQFSPEAVTIARAIQGTQRALVDAFRQYASDSAYANNDTMSLGLVEPPTKEQAFADAFKNYESGKKSEAVAYGGEQPRQAEPENSDRRPVSEARKAGEAGFLSLRGRQRPQPTPKTQTEQYFDDNVKTREAARNAGRKRPIERLTAAIRTLKAGMVDRTAPITDQLYQAQEQYRYTLRPENNIDYQIDRVLRASPIARQFIEDRGLERIIRNVDNIDHLGEYLIARNAAAVEKREIKTGRDLQKDAQAVADFDNRTAYDVPPGMPPIEPAGTHKIVDGREYISDGTKWKAPTYKDIAGQIREYNNGILDYSVESGLISKEFADKLKQIYPDYVPFKRIFSAEELESGAWSSPSVASLSAQSIIRKLGGSERSIENPLASMVMKTFDVFAQGERNKAGRMLARYRNLRGWDGLIEEVKPGEKVDARKTFSYLDNGKKRTFKTTSEIAGAAKALDVEQMNWLIRGAAVFTRMLKAGAVGVNIPFMASNVAADVIGTTVTSGGKSIGPDVIGKAFKEAATRDKLFKEMRREGTGFTSFDQLRENPQEGIEEIRAGRSMGDRTRYALRNPAKAIGNAFRAFEDVVGRSEEFSRARLYISAFDKAKADFTKATGKDWGALGPSQQATIEKRARMMATHEANFKLPNYLRHGNWMKNLNALIPFLNARIQGSRSLVRAGQDSPGATAFRLSLYAFLPSAIMTAWNLGDEERKKVFNDVAEYEKQGNFIFIPPGAQKDEKGNYPVVKMKVPPDLGKLVRPIQRAMEQWAGLNPVDFKDVAADLVGAVSPFTLDSALSETMPSALKAPLQSKANYDYFRNRQIVPDALERLVPEDQVQPWTSGTARKIGKALNASPMKVEQFIKDSLAGVGSQLLYASDKALAATGAIPESQVGGQDPVAGTAARFTKARGGEVEQRNRQSAEQLREKVVREYRAGRPVGKLIGEGIRSRIITSEQARAMIRDAATSPEIRQERRRINDLKKQARSK